MERYGWATIHEITDNGFYAFRVVGGKYQLAKENHGALSYSDFAQMACTNIKYLKQVFTTDFNADDCDAMTLPNKEDAESARDWLEGMFFCKKAKAI